MDIKKHVEGIVVASSHDPRLVSLRGPKGRGHNDAIHEHLTRAGYEPGEAVVILPKADYEHLVRTLSEPERPISARGVPGWE